VKYLKILLMVLLPILAIMSVVWGLRFSSSPRYNDTAVIKQIRSLNRWETTSYSIEKIIDKGTSGNVFERLLFGNRVLLIAHGEVIGGFDLTDLKDNSVKINGTSITVELPAPQVLSTSLNESETRVYDRQKGLLVAPDNNLESDARVEAVKAIRDGACSEGILNSATDNARKQISALLSSFGFTTITINIPQGSC
jgi:hypothetical protein